MDVLIKEVRVKDPRCGKSMGGTLGPKGEVHRPDQIRWQEVLRERGRDKREEGGERGGGGKRVLRWQIEEECW